MPVTVFNDAADLYVWQREGLRHQSDAGFLDYGFIKNGAVEIDDSAVRLDGPRFNAANVLRSTVVRNLDVRDLPSLFGKNLDTLVIRLAGPVVVAIDLPIEVDGGSSRRLGLALHFEIFDRYRQPIRGADRERTGHERKPKQHPRWH